MLIFRCRSRSRHSPQRVRLVANARRMPTDRWGQHPDFYILSKDCNKLFQKVELVLRIQTEALLCLTGGSVQAASSRHGFNLICVAFF